MSIEQLNLLLPELRRIKAMPLLPIKERRIGFAAMLNGIPIPADAKFEEVNAGGVPCVWCRFAENIKDRAILYLHGGAYTAGSADAFKGFAGQIGHAAHADVLIVDYRLAPEHPFPAAVEDAVAAYRWLLKQVSPGTRAAVVGDSAGGALALSLMMSLRDAQLPLPAAGVLLSPWTDLSMSGASIESRAELDPSLNISALAESARMYLAGLGAQNPLASPVFANLKGLPPLLIQAGAHELLVDDSIRLAANAAAADVKVTLQIWPSLFHVFQMRAHRLDEGREAICEIAHMLQDVLS